MHHLATWPFSVVEAYLYATVFTVALTVAPILTVAPVLAVAPFLIHNT